MGGLELRDVINGAVLVFIGTILSSGSKIIERVIIGRALGPEAYGQVAIALSILTIASYISLVGLQDGISRFIPRYEKDQDIRGVWATGATIAMLSSIILTIFLISNADKISVLLYNTPGESTIVIVMVAALPAFVLLRVGVGALRGVGNARARLLSFDIFFPTSRILLLLALLTLGVGTLSLPIAYFIASILGAGMIHLFLNRIINLRGPRVFRFREILYFSTPLVMATVASHLLTRADTLMLGYLTGSSAAGIYEAAYPIANGLVLVLSAFGFLYLPLISDLDSEGDIKGVAQAYQLTTKWAYFLTLPIFTTLVILPDFIINLVFSEAYSAASPVLIILSVGFFANSAFGRSRETLSALGYTKSIMIVNSIAFVINILLNLILIPRYKIIGAAIASAATFLLLNIIIVLVLYIRSGVTPYSSETVKTIILLPLTALPLAGIVRIILGPNIITFLIIPIVTILSSVFVLLVSSALEPEDLIALDLLESKTGLTIPYIRNSIQNNE